MIETWLNLLKEAAALPREVWAPILGLLSAWGLTQRLKFLLPARWSPKAREVSTQGLAFLTGWIVTGLVFPPLPMVGGPNPLGWIIGFVVGLAAPAIWNVGMLVVGWWKPDLAKLLSQNVRTTP